MICVHVLFVKKICMALRIRPWAHVSTWIDKILHFHINWKYPSLSHELTMSFTFTFTWIDKVLVQKVHVQAFHFHSIPCFAILSLFTFLCRFNGDFMNKTNIWPRKSAFKGVAPKIWNAISLLKTATHFWPCWQSYSQFHQTTCCWNLSGRVIANKLWIFKSLELTFYCQTVMQHFEEGWKYVFM